MMKKSVTIISLLIVIILAFSFVILRLLASGAEDNFFNQKYRQEFAQSHFLRNILGLHNDGDASADYLGSQYSKIAIEIDAMTGLSIPQASLDLLAEKITDVTGKSVEYIISDRSIPYTSRIDESEIKPIINRYQDGFNHPAAYVYVLVLSQSKQNPTSLGLTYHENGIILFEDEIRNFTDDFEATFNSYMESTILHEFGHQLGLPHNENPGCLMNAQADNSYQVVTRVSDVITDFCDYEKGLIRAR